MLGIGPCPATAGDTRARVTPLRLLTFTTLFPNEQQPNHGIFVENRLRHLVRSQDVQSTVMAPVPYFPLQTPWFGKWSHYARVPRRERRYAFDIHHPRYAIIPKIGMALAPFTLYRASLHTLRGLMAGGFEFDIIDAHYLYPDGIAAAWLGRCLGKPVIITARGSDVSELPRYAVPRRLIQHAVMAADGLVAVSQAIRDALLALGAPADRVAVLRNGVDTTLFRPTRREQMRQRLGLHNPTLLSVGHLIERKGHHHVIRAMALLPRYRLLIVGEGPERNALQTLAARLGVSDRVHLLGVLPHTELAGLYSAADALVLASSREGWANVLLEAMACGTPVLASNVWGNPEVVRDRAAGRVLTATTPEAIASGVKELFANLPPRAATRAYAERFGWDETSAGQVAAFHDILWRWSPRKAGGGS